MVHLLPLPGSPGARPMEEVLDRALRDLDALVGAGFGGAMVENYGDVPFHPGAVPPVTVACLARVAAALRARAPGIPLGINVLRNDAAAALGIAAACGARAIRVNVHSGARVTDQGLVEGRAWETLRLREAWGAGDVAVWADVAVKHSVALGAPQALEDEVADLVERGRADAVIVSGTGTGRPVDRARLAAVKAASAVPVLVGSGSSAETAAELLSVADGLIVGSWIKEGGRASAPVDPDRAAALVRAAGA